MRTNTDDSGRPQGTGDTPSPEKTWLDPRRKKSTGGASRTKKWITAHRVITLVLLVATLAVLSILTSKVSDLSDRSFAPISVQQTNKVETAATLLRTVGFNNPVYLGIKPATEGEYPTFRVEAIGGQPLEVFIRTTRNGGLEIQPDHVFQDVKSADDFAQLAAKAVFDWQHMPADIKPRTDGAFGDWEGRKYDFDNLAKYAPSQAYEDTPLNETRDWPRK